MTRPFFSSQIRLPATGAARDELRRIRLSVASSVARQRGFRIPFTLR